MTSGSTGRPKSVVQSEESLRYAGQATIDAIGLEPGDAIGAFVPLSSVAAYCFGMYLPAMLGSAMVCIASWKPDDALAAMARPRRALDDAGADDGPPAVGATVGARAGSPASRR